MLLIAICTGTRRYIFTKTLVKNFLKENKTNVSIKSIHNLEYSFSDILLWLDSFPKSESHSSYWQEDVNARRTTAETTHECQPIAIGHLDDSGDLKRQLLGQQQYIHWWSMHMQKISALKHKFGN